MSLRKSFVESLESRLLFAVAEPTPVARPVYNTGTGFFTSGGDIYDANGYQFTIRGFAHSLYWGNATKAKAAIAEFPKTRANAVRVVFGDDFGPSQYSIQRQRIVEQFIDEGIVPIIEDSSVTGHIGAQYLTSVVDKWLAPGSVQFLKKYEKQIILNIANEWGPDSQDWADQYKIAIDRIRAAGINCMLMIDSGDAPGPGQSAHTIETWGQELIDHDPQHNVVLSVHMYNTWRTEERGSEVGKSHPDIGNPWDIKTELSKMKATGLPIVVGEFSWQGAAMVKYNTRRAMEIFNDLNVGWLAWGWNQMQAGMNLVNDWQFNSNADLTKFGKRIINDPQFGLKKTSKQASIFQSKISGTIFNDLNSNGRRDVGESALAGATVFLDFNHDGGLNRNETVITTAADGSFLFGRLPSGTYDVRILPPGRYGAWKATKHGGVGIATVSVEGAKHLGGVNVGFHRATLSTAYKHVMINSSVVTIQAENFDNGGEGVAFHDNDLKNIGGKGGRGSGVSVDVQTARDVGGGNNIEATQAGEWLNYTANVAKTRLFDLSFRVAAADKGGKFHLEVDGNNVTGTISVPKTGNWQKWTTVTADEIRLTAGTHVLRLVMDANGSSGWVGNFNYFRIERSDLSSD